MAKFADRIRPHVTTELALASEAERRRNFSLAFSHLEKAHVLGQASTREHVRVHSYMLLWALRHVRISEVAGQAFRIVGAATKTVFGLVPSGNTGGSNISAFKRLPIPPELAAIISAARRAR